MFVVTFPGITVRVATLCIADTMEEALDRIEADIKAGRWLTLGGYRISRVSIEHNRLVHHQTYRAEEAARLVRPRRAA